ncbi:hypothetical protein DVJ83_05365 [Deinococcus wulumuqiensis]|uniref:Uncharacterized protein n=1 Tax=Deinococcus wulumuqiensis TaxID=980427 RepID=A0A345IG60_9DEIO|nr:hypothetical protein DVJ83_05365 [Deinococcus wulumuqiensis]
MKTPLPAGRGAVTDRRRLIRILLNSCTVGPIQLGRRRLCIHIAESVFFPTRIRSAEQLCKSD